MLFSFVLISRICRVTTVPTTARTIQTKGVRNKTADTDRPIHSVANARIFTLRGIPWRVLQWARYGPNMRLASNLRARAGLDSEKQVAAMMTNGVVGKTGMTVPTAPAARARYPATKTIIRFIATTP